MVFQCGHVEYGCGNLALFFLQYGDVAALMEANVPHDDEVELCDINTTYCGSLEWEERGMKCTVHGDLSLLCCSMAGLMEVSCLWRLSVEYSNKIGSKATFL